MKKPLYKSTIVIWTHYDPSEVDPQLMDLAFHAENEYVHFEHQVCTG